MKQNYLENAEWIFADCDASQVCDEYFEYCTSFEISTVSKTTLVISAYSQYAVYINGVFVNCGQYDDYEDYQVYDTLEISRYLQVGTNELYIGHYVCGADFSTRQKQIPGILFSIYNEEGCLLASNCNCLARKNQHFLKNGEVISRQLGFNFEYDANQKENPYKRSILVGKEKHLVPRPIEKLCIEPFESAKLCAQGIFQENKEVTSKAERMQTAYLSACRQNQFIFECEQGVHWSVPEKNCCDGVYMIFDLQKESTGLLEFTLDVPQEAEVLIGFGEHLEDLRVRSFVGGIGMSKQLFMQALLKFTLGIVLVGVLVFLPAGTMAFWQGWLFMGILFVPMFLAGIVLLKKNPELLKKRLNAKEKQKDQDLVVKLSGLMFLVGFVVAGLNYRFGWHVLPKGICIGAGVVFLLAYLLYAQVLRENTYLSRTIEVCENQKVIDTGLYGVVRHPMYSATLLLFLAMPLVLGSLLSFVIFLAYPVIIAKRIDGEEKFLEKELEGYCEYKKKVKYRLIPFVW